MLWHTNSLIDSLNGFNGFNLFRDRSSKKPDSNRLFIGDCQGLFVHLKHLERFYIFVAEHYKLTLKVIFRKLIANGSNTIQILFFSPFLMGRFKVYDRLE